MNLQQLEYIVAIDTHRSFAKAAAACFVTQPTLSSMVKKLEEELNVTLFDRTKPPVVPTTIGSEIVEHARAVLLETARLRSVAKGAHGGRSELRIGVIPTLAPYLIPLFLPGLLKKHKDLKVTISELTTAAIVDALVKEKIDVGILATPLSVPGLREEPLFHERFLIYASKDERIGRKKYVLPTDIDPDRLWLLEEGHCLRTQVMNLCELRKRSAEDTHLHYVSGSIGSLLRIVDTQGGLTIVPELAALEMVGKQKARLHEFAPPVPVREISTVTYRHVLKDRTLQALRESIRDALTDLKPMKRKQMSVVPLAPMD